MHVFPREPNLLTTPEAIDLRTLQELMGHADLVMISKVYAHLKGETGHLRSSLGKLAS